MQADSGYQPDFLFVIFFKLHFNVNRIYNAAMPDNDT